LESLQVEGMHELINFRHKLPLAHNPSLLSVTAGAKKKQIIEGTGYGDCDIGIDIVEKRLSLHNLHLRC
jgi:hypothetical protein